MRYRWDPMYPAGVRRFAVPSDAHLRASDAERNEVAERLARHFADGRLDQAEYRARLDRAMGATTRGDLGGLFDDLPPLEAEEPPAPRRRRVLGPIVFAVLLIAVVATVSAPFVRIPWFLVLVIGLLVWHRIGRVRTRGW